MKKIAITTLVCTLFTALCTGTMFTASAGINPNFPIGEGLLANGQLNETNFWAMDDAEPSAISILADDYSLGYNDGEWQEMLVNKGVPKDLMTKEGAKATLTYKFTKFPGKIGDTPSKNVQFMLTPGSSLADKFTYGYVLEGSVNGVTCVPSYRTSATDGDPATQIIDHVEGDKVYELSAAAWHARAWYSATFEQHIATFGEAYFRMELTVNDHNWIDVDLAEGPLQAGAIQWQTGAKVTNWAPYDGTTDLYANCWLRYAEGVVVDGATLEVSYPEGDTTKTDTLFSSDFDDPSKMVVDASAEPKTDCFIARGVTYAQLAKAEMLVTNPAKDMRIVSLAPLRVDTRMEKTFEMTVDYRIQTLAETRKIGIAFGLDDYEQPLSAPENGASFLYFAADVDGKVKLGAENIAADGTPTATGTEVSLDYTIGSQEYIKLSIVGNPDNSITVTVNGAEEGHNFPDFKLEGSIALAQTGTGDTTYGIAADTFAVTGYRFNENEGKAVSTTFNGNYINSNKFESNSITTGVDGYMTANENAEHGLDGMVAEDGKLGFYGTTTNTRIIFKDKYADFVLQFDYISELFNKRGNLVLAEGGFSPFYMIFGGDAPSDSFLNFYSIGIIEGNPGTNLGAESLVASLGGKFGVNVQPLANRTQISEPTEESITITKKDGTKSYWLPDYENSYKYSFYNRTTRVKLVVCNNRAEVYVAEVDPATNGIKGNYVLAFTDDAEGGNGTLGYVGLATDTPGWSTIDNLAITPIPTEKALAAGYGKTLGADLMPDVAVSDMDNDVEPTPLPQPKLTVDTTAKKVTWEAVDGAKEYEVTVKKDGETVIEKTTVTTTEFSLATLTAEGTYEVAVSAIPADSDIHLESRATVNYTVTAQGGTTPGGDNPGGTTPGGDNPGGTTPGGTTPGGTTPGDTDKGCGGIVGTSMIALFAVVTVAGALALVAKRKEN